MREDDLLVISGDLRSAASIGFSTKEADTADTAVNSSDPSGAKSDEWDLSGGYFGGDRVLADFFVLRGGGWLFCES